MSSLHRGDRHLHHADGSHRWSGGPADTRGREAYLSALREHLAQHRAGFAANAGPAIRMLRRPTPLDRPTRPTNAPPAAQDRADKARARKR
jgi:hypothetical protein